MSRGKRYKESSSLLDKSKTYELNEAIELLKKSSSAKFDETVELAARLGIDLRHADQAVRALSAYRTVQVDQPPELLPLHKGNRLLKLRRLVQITSVEKILRKRYPMDGLNLRRVLPLPI